jgi:hypothetical protein
MTRDDIIRMAREAGWTEYSLLHAVESQRLETFAALVAAAEREACAKACDGWMHANGNDCAEAIRARGEV